MYDCGWQKHLARGNCMEAIVRLKPLELTDRRQSSRAVHTYLRELILGGSFAPGAILSQLELSKILGVSRTPLREAFRMLQEEGLIEAEPNLRARVSAFSADDLATVYASRIVLESLGISLTASTFSLEQKQTAEDALNQMHIASEKNNFSEWKKVHRAFHNTLNSQAGPELLRLIQTLIERAERYLLIYQPRDEHYWRSEDCEIEHRQLLQVCLQHCGDKAALMLARHLATFANMVLTQLEPAHQATIIQAALQIVDKKAAENSQKALPASLSST
jgi:DNA-binding GntR family transcriptional regulator